jgi:hypothetical protein
MKRTKVRHNVSQVLLGWYDGATQKTQLYFDTADKLVFLNQYGGTTYQNISTTGAITESDWIHVYVYFNCDSAIYKVFLDGIEQALTVTTNTAKVTNAYQYRPLSIGSDNNSANFFDGYLADINIVHGAGTSSLLNSFGTASNSAGGFKPKKYSGSYGTGGANLTFANGSSLSNLMLDTSGNNRTFTGNGFSITSGTSYSWSDDVPTKSYAYLANGYNVGTGAYNLNGGLQTPNLGAVYIGHIASIPMTRGKYYYELLANAGTYHGLGFGLVNGITPSYNNGSGYWIGQWQDSWSYFNNGYIYNNAATIITLPSYGANDVVACAFDADNWLAIFYKNGVEVTRFVISSGEYIPMIHNYGSTSNSNYGSMPCIPGATYYPEADGWFKYPPPTGYKALNSKTLWGGYEESRDGSKSFHVEQKVFASDIISTSNPGFAPDLLLYNNKITTAVEGFNIFDRLVSPSGTGTTKIAIATAATSTGATTTFNSTGYTHSYTPAVDGDSFLGYAFKAGGVGVSSTKGTIASTVSANPDGGFSIVKYTGNGVISSIGHGLNKPPSMIWIKKLNAAATGWAVLVSSPNVSNVNAGVSLDSTKLLSLNSTTASTAGTTYWDNTSTNSNTFSVSTDTSVNNTGDSYIAYCFADVIGRQKIGKYTGYGALQGPYIPCGFKPKFLMIKRYDSTGNWQVVDSARNAYNEVNKAQYLNAPAAESVDANRGVHFIRNGFKLTKYSADWNASNAYYLYLAIGDIPARRVF